MTIDLELRRDVGDRIDENGLNALVKEFGYLSETLVSGRMFDRFRRDNWLSNDALSRFDSGSRGPAMISMQLHGAYQLSKILEILEIYTTEATKLYNEAMARVGPIGLSIGKILNGMPSELLSLTVEKACNGMRDLVKLSHVNHRFRGVAEGLPHLCSHIAPNTTPSGLDASIAWSKNVGLQIQISQYQCIPANTREVPLQLYLDKIIPVSHRWQSLELLCANENFLQDPTGYVQIQTRITGLHLPSLQCLEYTYMRSGIPGENVSPSGHIYSTWRVPNLRDALFRKIIPKPFAHSITTLTLELPHRVRNDEELSHHLKGVHLFLKESPSIEVLRICTPFLINEGFNVTYPRVVMPNVRNISLRCTFVAFEDPKIHPLSSFMRSLNLPTISELRIEFEIHDKVGFNAHHTLAREVDITDTILLLIPSDSHRIRTLSFEIVSNSYNLLPSFHIPFHVLPSLQDLSLECSGHSNNILLTSERPSHSYDFPPIKRLSIYGSRKEGESFLEQILRLFAKSNGEELKPLVDIKYCSSITEARAIELVGAGSLKYSTAR
ncbi:hypothetical protein SCHPADRAFT_1002382 [Schizopora paradoxa]|uniref:F-box domain-containing protein n=1 Tax=Schizopora paradoxa TaxID=27342 RepID=A0A0H2R3J3_9AGAM|nr:hypothetical protein SCHPADRAFT_1002382 [Schizopora paradoxa]